jgi:hypothetical protein
MSPKFSLDAIDIQKWISNLLLFLAPVALIYILATTALITGANGVVTLSDFVPNSVTIGAMTLYVLNAVTDLLRKFTAGTTA